VQALATEFSENLEENTNTMGKWNIDHSSWGGDSDWDGSDWSTSETEKSSEGDTGTVDGPGTLEDLEHLLQLRDVSLNSTKPKNKDNNTPKTFEKINIDVPTQNQGKLCPLPPTPLFRFSLPSSSLPSILPISLLLPPPFPSSPFCVKVRALKLLLLKI
jgi:hypothetical protein